jgi:hypothetical protein
LIEAVNRTLRMIDTLKSDVVAARNVLLMPQLKIPQVVFLNEQLEAIARHGGRLLVPTGGEGGLMGG